MKSVETVKRFPKFGCGVKSFRFDILIRNRLAVPFPGHEGSSIWRIGYRGEGYVAPNGRNRGWLWALSGGDGFGSLLPAESFLHSLR